MKSYSSTLDVHSLNLSQGSQTNVSPYLPQCVLHLESTNLNVANIISFQRLIDSLRSKPRDVDILITTPGSLSLALRARAIDSSLVNHIIIDEADTLMDNSFNKTTVYLLNQLSVSVVSIVHVVDSLTLFYMKAFHPVCHWQHKSGRLTLV